MTSRLLTFAVWALVAASGLFWGLKLFVRPAALPASIQLASRGTGSIGELVRVLGAPEEAATEDEPAAGEADGRFRLLGVVAPAANAGRAQGVALIAVGDQPARAWRTGAVIEGETVLLSVGKRSAQLGPRGGPATTELSLPEPVNAGGAAPAGSVPARPIVPPQVHQLRPMPAPQAPAEAPKQGSGQGEEDDD